MCIPSLEQPGGHRTPAIHDESITRIGKMRKDRLGGEERQEDKKIIDKKYCHPAFTVRFVGRALIKANGKKMVGKKIGPLVHRHRFDFGLDNKVGRGKPAFLRTRLPELLAVTDH
jgi:hypothetical protein